tara:strand:- start:794 stop:1015 length:222 start_codon:yes stop_codon:yes gene_type:complete
MKDRIIRVKTQIVDKETDTPIGEPVITELHLTKIIPLVLPEIEKELENWMPTHSDYYDIGEQFINYLETKYKK